MTFCLGLRSDEGLLAIADTRITSGTEVSRAPKISVHDINGHPLFILTSGLRSVRDKAIIYFNEGLSAHAAQMAHTYEAANVFANEIRRVRAEDRGFLADAGLAFDLHCIVGGRLSGDQNPEMFLVYPEGNWVEVNPATPYVIIGESRYGKPVLDRLWKYEDSLADGLRIGLLAFTETKASASNVDYPLDAVQLDASGGNMREMQISQGDGAPIEAEWDRALSAAAESVRFLTAPLYERLRTALEAATEPRQGGSLGAG
jgi:putative proteasome-type protease